VGDIRELQEDREIAVGDEGASEERSWRSQIAEDIAYI
jgi:hypothetical protein